MITVLPVREADRLSVLYKTAGEPLPANAGAVVAADGEEQLGYCLYTLDGEKISIGRLEPVGDIALADGILRAALHVAVTKGLTQAVYTDRASEDLLKRLEFIENDEKHTLRLEKLFSTCQNCAGTL
ncbi:MAG: hypothetical protein ACOYKJ_03045 [Candidatus Howiella sp.]|jgi:hypothetical protein